MGIGALPRSRSVSLHKPPKCHRSQKGEENVRRKGTRHCRGESADLLCPSSAGASTSGWVSLLLYDFTISPFLYGEVSPSLYTLLPRYSASEHHKDVSQVLMVRVIPGWCSSRSI